MMEAFSFANSPGNAAHATFQTSDQSIPAAKEIAFDLPPARVGTVELRPVWEREDLVARRVTAGRDRTELARQP